VLDLLIALHAAHAEPPRADDFTVPRVAELMAAMEQTATPWRVGPYGTRARDLLATHAAGLTALLAAYADLAARVSARPDRMVITHGEPHSGNVLRTPCGLALVDWDTVLLAPPERDLWGLAEADAAIPSVYAAATGVPIDDDALTLYRLWYDLAEIAEYISLFRSSHGDTADTAEAWRNLRHFLRPAERWPELLAGRI
jgi:aminoglycoside phosphotransferase (APT) family kinase protein